MFPNKQQINYIMANQDNGRGIPSTMRTVFGVFMIIIYVGMGILLFIDFFDFSAGWQWLRWVGGSLFVVYGLWRAYRQFSGIDSSI